MSNNNINNMIIVTDAYGRQKTILTNYLPRTPKFFEDGHLEQLDGLLTYQFSTLASDPATTHLVAGNNVIVRNKDRKLVMFTIIRTREERRDGKYVRTVFAENAAVDDLYNNICDGEELRAVSARNAATKVLEGTGWQVGNVDDAGLQNVNLNEYPTALAALHMIRDQYGLELEFTVSFIGTKVRDRYVHLVKKRGNVTGKRFTYGKDLTGITREVDRSDLATAIIPIGKADENGKRLTIEAFQNIFEEYVSPKGQKWVGDEKAMQLYGKDGKHLFKRLDLSGVDNEYELMKRAVEELRRTKQPRVTYEISCLLLEALSGYEHEKVRLGDTILVKDTMFDPVLAVKARVIAIYRSYTDPSKDYVVLGEFVPLVIDKNKQIQAIQDTINQNMTKWEQGGEVVLKSPNEPVKSKRTPDMLWLDTSAQPNVMRRWDAENNRWVNASATTPQEIGAETPEGAQKKADKAEGTAIAEAAEDAAIKAKKAEDKAIEVAEEMDESVKIELKSYVEGLTEEVEAEVKKHADKKAKDAELNAKLFAEGYAEKEWHYGDTPPEDLAQIWFDMSSNPNKIRKYNPNTKEWEAASPTSPKDIGAADPTEVIEEANKARDAAIKEAKAEANKAKDAAITEAKKLDESILTESKRIAKEAEDAANKHTNNVTKEVEEALKKDSQEKADEAKQGAISDADKKILEARKEAATDAQNKANEAQKKAEENADKNVTNKIAEMSVSTRNLLIGTKGVSITATNNGGNITSRGFTFRDYPNAKLDVQGEKLILSFVATGKVEEWGKTNPWIGMEVSVYYMDGDKVWLPVRFDSAGGNGGTRLELGKQYNREVVTHVITVKDKPIQDIMCQTLIRDMAKGTMKLEEFKVGIGTMYTGYDVPLEELDTEFAETKKHADTKAKEAQEAATKRANEVKTEVENFAKDAGNITQGTLAAQRLHGVTISGKSAKIVDIDAGNINVGTLDAARLKAGSINAELLEFGGRLRNVAGNAKTEYSSGDLIANGMTGIDNVNVPRWMVKQFPATATIDLGTIIGEVCRIGFTTYYTTDARYIPKSFKIETSINGTTWDGVADITNNTTGDPKSYTFGGRQVRYIRMIVREPQAGQTACNIANFEVLATQGGSILTGDSIVTGRIDATKVNVDNLNAGNIKSGTVHADRIGANSITAQKIAAGAVTTENLHVLAKSLVANTSLTGNDSTGWNIGKHTTSTVGLRASTNMGDVLVHGFTTAEHEQPTTYQSVKFEVDPNQTYKFSIGMFLDKNTRNSSQYFGLHAFDKNGKELPMQPLNPTTGALSGDPRTNPYFWSGKEVSGSWRFMEGYAVSAQADANEAPQGRNIQASYRMHPATKTLMMRFYSGYYPTVKNAAMEVLWWSPSVTAVDSGTIIADRITAGVIDANKVRVTNLRAGDIVSGTMTADRINGGTINAANTNIINLKAGNIVSGTLDAAKVSVINLDASKITTGMLNVGGTQIAKGTDFMRKDWKPLRASIANSINENYLITGGAQAKEEYVYLPRFDLNGGGGEKVTLSYEYNVDANYVVLPEVFVLASKQTTEALIDSVNHDYVHVLAGSESPEDIGGGWKRVTKTFSLQNDIKSAVLRLDHNGSKDGKTCNYRYRRVMLNYGSVALTWSPHTEESIGIGAITADNIRAGAITANKLTVGDFTNLVPNSAFINGTMEDWDRGNVVGSASAGVPAGAPSSYVRSQTERDTYAGDWFPVKTGDRFYCELTAATSNSGVPISLGLHYVDKDNKPYWTVFTPRINPTGGKWVTQGGEIHISIANATKAKVFVQVDGTTGSTFGTWYMTNAKIHRKTDANLLVDGSVTASKIVANAITADKVAANAITTDKIAANAINASKIAANSIDASKIAAGSITTEKIAAAGITADKITSGILDANRVQVRNLNASVITAGTMSADRITGGTINANNTNIINLKAQNIASGTINADNVAISNGRVTLNKDGVTVTEANFLVKDAQTGLTHSTAPASNLISDHSFELLKADPNSDFWAQNYRKIDRTFIGNGFDGWAIVGDPYMADLYTGDADESVKLFGKKSIIVNTANYVWQDISVKANKKYSISFHCARPLGTPANEVGSPQVQVEYVKDRNVLASEVKNFAIPPNPVGTWVRYGFTVTANGGLNGRDNRIRLRFRTNNHWYLLIDGMQAVENDTPVAYNAEDSLFLMSNNRLSPVSMTLRNLMMQGNTRIEGGGLSIAGQNINGVGLEMSEILRVWGKPIEARNTHVSAHGYQCIASRPAGVDRMIWVGWHDQAGNAIYVYIGGSWKVAVRL
ncbi:phage tail spike protein [Bacillus cereus]|nr:phage tail spike protein [Bacillus cereus]